LAPATSAADKVADSRPPGDFDRRVWLPAIRAAIELKRGNPKQAVELLAPVTPDEASWSDHYWSAYLRGEAYLAAHHGHEAAVEFQKIIDHPGAVLISPIGALAHLGLGRSYALEGQNGKAAAAYQGFLALWKDADADIPVLISAKSEYARLP
jgi:hypothetical protein